MLTHSCSDPSPPRRALRRLGLLAALLALSVLLAAALVDPPEQPAHSHGSETVKLPQNTPPMLVVLPEEKEQVAAGEPWEPVAPGIDYRYYHYADPMDIYVARMDRANLDVTIESALALGKLTNSSGKGNAETVSGMASRYDQALNFWDETWGNRNQVAVAINGSFVDPATGFPDRHVVQSGWYARRVNNNHGSGFVWTLNRNAFAGECVTTVPAKQYVNFSDGGDPETISGVNVARGSNDLILYTPQWDRDTHTDNSGIEVVVEMSAPTMVMSGERVVTGVIRQIREAGSTPIQFDQVVISASGDRATSLRSKVTVGGQVGITQAIKHFLYLSGQDCYKVDDVRSWERTYASVGGSFVFLRDGKVQTFTDQGANLRHPRTAIAYNDQYIYFIVVDGRDPFTSIGMTMGHLGNFALKELQATHGIAEDGGGSSAMVVNGEVVNFPSDYNYLRPRLFMPVIAGPLPGTRTTRASPPQFITPRTLAAPATPTPDPSPTPLAGSVALTPTPTPTPTPFAPLPAGFDGVRPQRAVVNGLLMVVVLPKEQSTRFSEGQAVITRETANLRLGPGTNYEILTTLPPNTSGQVVAHANGLNGVLAKGSHWWKVQFNTGSGSFTGWISESLLVAP